MVKKYHVVMAIVLFQFCFSAFARLGELMPMVIDVERSYDGTIRYVTRMQELVGQGPGPGYRYHLEALYGPVIVHTISTPEDSAPDFDEKFAALFGERKEGVDSVVFNSFGGAVDYFSVCASYTYNNSAHVTLGCAGVREMNTCSFSVENLHRNLGTVGTEPIDVDFAVQVNCIKPTEIKIKDKPLKGGSCELVWKDETTTKVHHLIKGENTIPITGVFQAQKGFTGHCETSRILMIDVQ